MKPLGKFQWFKFFIRPAENALKDCLENLWDVQKKSSTCWKPYSFQYAEEHIWRSFLILLLSYCLRKNWEVVFNFFLFPKELLEKLTPFISKKTTHLRLPISPEEKLALTLRFLATGESYQNRTSTSSLRRQYQNLYQKLRTQYFIYLFYVLKFIFVDVFVALQHQIAISY